MEHPRVSELRPSKSALTIHGLGIQVVTKENDCTNVRSRLQIQGCYACVAVDEFTAVITHPAMIRLESASVFTPITDTQELSTQYFDFATRRKKEIEAKKERGIVGMDTNILLTLLEKKNIFHLVHVLCRLHRNLSQVRRQDK
ncbi:hypothetical protein Hanom_Chr09g00810711 [Helianthus anomalus]